MQATTISGDIVRKKIAQIESSIQQFNIDKMSTADVSRTNGSSLETLKLELEELRKTQIQLEDIETLQPVEQTVWKDTKYYNTICRKHDQACHERCGLSLMEEQGSSGFSGCSCMNGKVCGPCGCEVETHVHMFKVPQKIFKTAQELFEERKKEFEEKNAQILAKQSELDAAGDKLSQCERELLEFEEKLSEARSVKDVTAAQEQMARQMREELLAKKQQADRELSNTSNSMRALKDNLLSVENQIKQISESIQREMDAVPILCKKLKEVCKGFNFGKELEVSKVLLEQQKESLTDPDARSEIDTLIKGLNQLAKDLQLDKPY